MSESSPDTSLSAVCERYQVSLPEGAAERLEKYCRLLWDWNEKLNLTRHVNYDLFVTRDLVDAQRLSELLAPRERVVDMGAGGGVPGLVVAILRPDVRMELSECIGKKARALQDMVTQLELKVPVHSERIEQLLARPRSRFDTVIARAVGPLGKMLFTLRDCWPAMGRLLVVKGPKWVEERGEARHRGYLRDLDLRRMAQYPIPGAEWESVILAVSPKQPKK